MDKIYPFAGTVIKGLQNGRKFGFPTANISLERQDETLDIGIYAAELLIKEKLHYGMLYVGIRPTLNMSQLTIEINIFDFDSDIYGEVVEFRILKKIREDIKFDSVEQLIAQIKKDKDETLCYLGL